MIRVNNVLFGRRKVIPTTTTTTSTTTTTTTTTVAPTTTTTTAGPTYCPLFSEFYPALSNGNIPMTQIYSGVWATDKITYNGTQATTVTLLWYASGQSSYPGSVQYTSPLYGNAYSTTIQLVPGNPFTLTAGGINSAETSITLNAKAFTCALTTTTSTTTLPPTTTSTTTLGPAYTITNSSVSASAYPPNSYALIYNSSITTIQVNVTTTFRTKLIIYNGPAIAYGYVTINGIVQNITLTGTNGDIAYGSPITLSPGTYDCGYMSARVEGSTSIYRTAGYSIEVV